MYTVGTFNLHLGESILTSFVDFMRAYFVFTSLRIWSMDNGLVFPLVCNEFHSPLVVNPTCILKCSFIAYLPSKLLF